MEVIELTPREHSYTVPNLKEGEELAFRIRAVNAAGPGEPSRPTDLIKIEDQPGLFLADFLQLICSVYQYPNRKTIVSRSECYQRHNG